MPLVNRHTNQPIIERPIYIPDVHLFSRFRVYDTDSVPLAESMWGLDTRYLQPILYFMARGIHARTIVEIGAGKGGSCLPLLKAASEMHGTLHSVDPGISEESARIVARYGLEWAYRFHQMTSDTFFAQGAAPGSIDFAFVDGEHSCGAVSRDAVNILDRLVPGGIVVFHEYRADFVPPYETIMHLPREGAEPSENYGTPRALRETLGRYDVDVMPLDWGACGKDRVEEWTEFGAIMVRKRYPQEFVVLP